MENRKIEYCGLCNFETIIKNVQKKNVFAYIKKEKTYILARNL